MDRECCEKKKNALNGDLEGERKTECCKMCTKGKYIDRYSCLYNMTILLKQFFTLEKKSLINCLMQNYCHNFKLRFFNIYI